MAIGRFLAPLNGRIIQQETPYVDDIFDPLFNAEVTNYYRGLYGPIGGIGAGYAAMLENALAGRKGILGPGMGILSTFGRSMDKADDFILGGLTEGVNLIGNGLRGTNPTPTNPIKNIFVNDYDYQGTKLMAAMGNAMAKLTGTQTPLDESDFSSLGDRAAGTIIDLATDPGIMGGQLERLNPNTPVGKVGHLLNEYDDIMANVAGNMAFPGGKALTHKFIKKIQDVNTGLGAFKTGNIKDVHLTNNPTDVLKEMVDNYVEKNNIKPGHPEWNDYEDFIKSLNPEMKTAKTINLEASTKVTKEPTATEILTDLQSRKEKILKTLINDQLKDLKLKYGLDEAADADDVLAYLNNMADRYDKNRLIPLINKERDLFRRTKMGIDDISATDIIKKRLDEAEDLVTNKKWDTRRVRNLQEKISESKPNILSKDEFLDRILTSRKQFTDLDATDPLVTGLRNALKQNLDEINKNSKEPILTLIDQKTKSGKIRLGYMVNTANKSWIKDFQKVAKKKDLNLVDTLWHLGKTTTYTKEEQEVLDFFTRLDTDAKRYSTWLGIPRNSDPHIRMVMEGGPDASSAAMQVYKDIGLNKEESDLLLAEIKNANNRLLKKGAFGTVDIANSYLGTLKNSPYRYNYDLKAIALSTFTDSYMDNANVQATVCLLDNPALTLKTNFDSPKFVKEALFADTGNENLSLVTLKLDNKNQIIGFHRYNKFSDLDIEKAYNDPNCIICPEDIVGTLEKAFDSNKRIPHPIIEKMQQLYKASILNNFAFPLGNFGDAFTKQSIEIGRHFGDSMPEAMFNTAESMKNILELNELFDKEVMGDLKAFLASDTAKKDPFFKKYAANKISLNSGIIFSKPELSRMFDRYINVMPAGPHRNLAIFYRDLCADIDITTGKYKDPTQHVRFNEDLKDFNSMYDNNPYTEKTMSDKILYGNKDKKIPGLINNPLTNLTLGTSENYIEPMARGGTYLNYLKHKGYTMNEIYEILGFSGHVNPEKAEEFKKACQEAINTMYATNFNYESMSKFQKVFARFVPFPTFYLKNIAFWLDVADKNPQIIDNTISLHEGMWSGKDTDDEFVAEAKGRGAVPIGQQKGIKHLTGLVKPTLYNSMFGAFNAINNPAESFAQRANPLLRPVTRHLQPDEDTKYRPYNTNQYQKNITKADPQFSELAYMFHQLNPYEKVVNTGLRTPGKVSNNTYQLSDFLPSIFQPDFSKKTKK